MRKSSWVGDSSRPALQLQEAIAGAQGARYPPPPLFWCFLSWGGLPAFCSHWVKASGARPEPLTYPLSSPLHCRVRRGGCGGGGNVSTALLMHAAYSLLPRTHLCAVGLGMICMFFATNGKISPSLPDPLDSGKSRSPPKVPIVVQDDSLPSGPPPQIRILKRPTSNGVLSSPHLANRPAFPVKSLAQREAEYAEARKRILGSASPEEEQDKPILDRWGAGEAGGPERLLRTAALHWLWAAAGPGSATLHPVCESAASCREVT